MIVILTEKNKSHPPPLLILFAKTLIYFCEGTLKMYTFHMSIIHNSITYSESLAHIYSKQDEKQTHLGVPLVQIFSSNEFTVCIIPTKGDG